jgi:hypothetical protein
MTLSRRWIGLVLLILAAVWLRRADAMDPRVKEIVIQPAGPPRPALRYRLLPPLSDQMPGVAAPLYAQAFLAMQEKKVDEATWKKLQNDWPNCPLEKLPKEEARRALEKLKPVLDCVDQAARRPRYGADLAPQDYVKVLSTLPAQVDAFRTVMRLLVVRIRYEILEGDHDGAIRSIQTGYAMARHCAEQPTALHAVVGSVLIEIVNRQMRDLIQMPRSPNLYWSIAALPEPMIDFQPMLDFESMTFESMFPEVQRAKAAGATPDQWRAILEKMAFSPPWQAPGSWRGGPPAVDMSPAGKKQMIDALLPKGLPIANRVLKAGGTSDAELDKMSSAEVAVRAMIEFCRVQHDELAKWYRLPYWQAKPAIERQIDEFRGLLPEAGPWMNQALLPVISAESSGQYQRDLAGLRCVEAIRLYAAEHGKLPQSLEAITEVPVPVNPLTGKPFRYRSEERYVILDLDGEVANYQYWIRLAD